MIDPKIIPRAEHGLSRKLIDPDALRVLYRLHEQGHRAYLVGGGVRDLLLGRRPKDFDVGTDAHPYQIKRLFRNCWIIGRRFRLAHVRFGPTKVVEVATFRRHLLPGTEQVPALSPEGPDTRAVDAGDTAVDAPTTRIVHDDNTFGTPEEDAFRRDFTINALFYDISSLSIIDYTGGLNDLRTGVIRCIGDPDERFQEDPVRMLRAVVFASRLGFTLDEPVRRGIAQWADRIQLASPARVLDEVYKILRSGYAAETFDGLAATGLLGQLAPEFRDGVQDGVRQSLARLDAYRRVTFDAPPNLSNAVLLASIIVPLGMMPRHARPVYDAADATPLPTVPALGRLPLARKDLDRIAHMLTMQPRLAEKDPHPRRERGMVLRPSFVDALTWMDIHGNAPDVVEHWQNVVLDQPIEPTTRPPADVPVITATPDAAGEVRPPRRRRRGRRR